MFKFKKIPGYVIQEYSEGLEKIIHQSFVYKGESEYYDKHNLRIEVEDSQQSLFPIELIQPSVSIEGDSSSPTLTLKYNLIEDKYDWETALNGGALLAVIEDMKDKLRSKLKWSVLSEEEYKIYEHLQEVLLESICEHNIPEFY